MKEGRNIMSSNLDIHFFWQSGSALLRLYRVLQYSASTSFFVFFYDRAGQRMHQISRLVCAPHSDTRETGKIIVCVLGERELLGWPSS